MFKINIKFDQWVKQKWEIRAFKQRSKTVYAAEVDIFWHIYSVFGRNNVSELWLEGSSTNLKVINKNWVWVKKAKRFAQTTAFRLLLHSLLFLAFSACRPDWLENNNSYSQLQCSFANCFSMRKAVKNIDPDFIIFWFFDCPLLVSRKPLDEFQNALTPNRFFYLIGGSVTTILSICTICSTL